VVQELPGPRRERAILLFGSVAGPLRGGRHAGTFGFWYTSAYVHGTGETGDLVASADSALLKILEHADLIAGHQLSSDLAVLAAAAGAPLLGVTAAQVAWRRRGQLLPDGPRLLDTRYDTRHVLQRTSRRLVDVCAELRLTQPELRGTSMTALHRRWLEQAEIPAREKITVLNLRHALSTALVAANVAGLASWPPGLNVNKILAAGLDGALGWPGDPVFAALLEESGAP
jgi:hypothetical protein